MTQAKLTVIKCMSVNGPARQRGLTMVEVLFALMIYLIFIGSIAALMHSGAQNVRQGAAATQLRSLVPGIEAYVKANYSTLEASATATTAVTVPFTTLRAGGYFPANFNNTNPYGQTYTLYVLQPTAGNLMALTLGSGGSGYVATNMNSHEFADRIIPGVAGLAGAEAGFVSTNNLPGHVTGEIRGAFGGWTVSLTGTNIPNPGPGHLALMQYFNQGSLASDFLYRYAVPGQPQLNQMFTDLNMGGNNLTNAKNVDATGTIAASGVSTTSAPANGVGGGVRGWDLYAQDGVYVGKDASNNPTVSITKSGDVKAEGDVSAENGNILLSHAIFYSTLVSNGTTITRPTFCPSGTVPQIFITQSDATGGASAYPMAGFQGWATVSGPNWIVHLRVLTQSGWASPPAPYLVGKADVKCGT